MWETLQYPCLAQTLQTFKSADLRSCITRFKYSTISPRNRLYSAVYMHRDKRGEDRKRLQVMQSPNTPSSLAPTGGEGATNLPLFRVPRLNLLLEVLPVAHQEV